MATATVKRLRWQLAHVLRAVGLPGHVAVAVLLGSAVVEGVLVRPSDDTTARLSAANAASEQLIATATAHPATPSATPAEQMTAFQQRFPSEREMSAALAGLVGVARARGVRLDQAEFRFVSEASEPLQRYSILLPAKADYRSLRRFMHDALRNQPALALADMNLRRGDPKSPVLEAQMRFVLFVRRPA